MRRIFPLFIILLMLFAGGCGASPERPVLHVAMPYSDRVQDVESNYYLGWLEEQTGLELDITLIRQSRSSDYLDALFASDADIDVVMFGNGFEISESELEDYRDRLYEAGGKLYYTNYGSGPRSGAGQILWINRNWLESLGLTIPSDTEELKNVLEAFRDNDMNGNGLADEIPLAGSSEDYANLPSELLLNSWCYNDPWHSRYAPDGSFAADSDSFREGISYCRELCSEGLLDERSFSFSRKQLCELVNSPEDLVGAFTTASVSDVIYPGNTEILARYVHVPPLEGPGGIRNSVRTESEPAVGAVITARSSRKEEAVLLLDTMLTEEASLTARFGEKGVDWDFSVGGDVSVYGGHSTIVTKNYLWNTYQNKHLNGIGPMNVPAHYLEGVTWNGVNSDAEYIDGRAQMSCRAFLPEQTALHERDEELSEYTDKWVRDFVTGEKDIGSDEAWGEYLKGLR